LLPVNFLHLPSTDFSVGASASGGSCSTLSQSVCVVAESTFPVTDDLLLRTDVLLLGFHPILLKLFLKHEMTYLLTMTL